MSLATALAPVCSMEHSGKLSQPAQAAVEPQAACVLAWHLTGLLSCSVLGYGERDFGLRALRLRPHASISMPTDSWKTELGKTKQRELLQLHRGPRKEEGHGEGCCAVW